MKLSTIIASICVPIILGVCGFVIDAFYQKTLRLEDDIKALDAKMEKLRDVAKEDLKEVNTRLTNHSGHLSRIQGNLHDHSYNSGVVKSDPGDIPLSLEPIELQLDTVEFDIDK